MQVAVIGATGFVGQYIVDALLAAGHHVSALVRPGSEQRLPHSDRCRRVAGDLASGPAIQDALGGAEAVIYNVGILREFPSRQVTFEKLHFEGAVRIIRAAGSNGIRRFLLMSANGVRRDGTAYQSTKYRAEQALAESGLDFTIIRPSVIFGDPHGRMEFATQLNRDMVSTPLPAIDFRTRLWGGSEVMMSPVWVEDVARAFAAALDSEATVGKTCEFGGPDQLSWSEMVRRVAEAVGRRVRFVTVPIPLLKPGAMLLDWIPAFPVTRDQLAMLAEGNVAAPTALQALIGREPRAFTPEALAYLRHD